MTDTTHRNRCFRRMEFTDGSPCKLNVWTEALHDRPSKCKALLALQHRSQGKNETTICCLNLASALRFARQVFISRRTGRR